jgi:hypothetical protein
VFLNQKGEPLIQGEKGQVGKWFVKQMTSVNEGHLMASNSINIIYWNKE